MSNLKINAGTLVNQCWTNPQAFANDFASVSSVLLEDLTGIIIDDAAPGVNDRDKAWIKTSSGAPVWPSGPYIFYNGSWLAPHPIAYSSSLRWIWVGAEADIALLDGGTAGVVTDVSGPFWERDTVFNGRTIIGVGDIPGTSGPTRSVAVNGTADSQATSGEWRHTLLRAELPAEPLKLFTNEVLPEPLTDIGVSSPVGRRADVDSEKQSYRLSQGTGTPTVGVTDNLGSATPFINAPPFIGVFLIKRTARKYWVG
jgi:hypothetical protein